MFWCAAGNKYTGSGFGGAPSLSVPHLLVVPAREIIGLMLKIADSLATSALAIASPFYSEIGLFWLHRIYRRASAIPSA